MKVEIFFSLCAIDAQKRNEPYVHIKKLYNHPINGSHEDIEDFFLYKEII